MANDIGGYEMSKRYSHEEKEHIIRDYKASGLTSDKFCQEIGICKSTLFKWIKRSKKSNKSKNNQLIFLNT